jgi:putative acetyltransferase
MDIIEARTPAELSLCAQLFREYAAWLKVDLCFQGFEEELANLPGPYAAPRGRLLLAVGDAQAMGCIALKPLAGQTCEIKRLFVRPPYQRAGVGRRLVERAIEEARMIGYAAIRLDSLERLKPAIRLYESVGFLPCAPYYDTPLVHTVFMELPLSAGLKCQ